MSLWLGSCSHHSAALSPFPCADPFTVAAVPSYVLRLHLTAAVPLRVHTEPDPVTGAFQQERTSRSVLGDTRDMEVHVNNLFTICNSKATCHECARMANIGCAWCGTGRGYLTPYCGVASSASCPSPSTVCANTCSVSLSFQSLAGHLIRSTHGPFLMSGSSSHFCSLLLLRTPQSGSPATRTGPEL